MQMIHLPMTEMTDPTNASGALYRIENVSYQPVLQKTKLINAYQPYSFSIPGAIIIM